MTGRPTTILLAEDNDDHAELILKSLNSQRLTRGIIRVSNGEDALDNLLNRGEFTNPEKHPLPDLILLDLRMPKITGFDVIKEVKTSEGLRQIPVVILTTSNSEHDISRAYELGANSYLVKPVELQALSQMLDDLGKFSG
jgi:CheY-like chemotaxis protein